MMSNIKKGISVISKEIEETIQKEMKNILEEANNKKVEILEEASKKAKLEIDKLNRETKKIIEKEENRINSLIRLETRRNTYVLKDNLINQVFEKIEDKLKRFSETEQYVSLLHNFTKKSIEQIVNLVKRQEKNPEISLLIGLNQVDREKLSNDWVRNLENKFNVKLKLSPPIQSIGGVIISTEDYAISYDNTFEGRLSRRKSKIRMKIASILFPEEE